VLGCLLFVTAASYWPNAATLLFHNPKLFQFAEGPQDGQYSFGNALYAVPGFTAGGLDCGSFSSSNDPEMLTRTFSVMQTADPKLHPLKEALIPEKAPIVQGAIGLKDRSWTPSHQIAHPANCLVDISALSASILSLPHEILSQSKEFGLIDVANGDYVTNQLTLRTQLTHSNPGRVRIFVRDEPGLAKGITVDHGSINSKPADFQIWYNGTGTIELTGRSSLSCIIYAPHAYVDIGPEVSLKGAIVCRYARIDQGGSLFFDRDLKSITDWR